MKKGLFFIFLIALVSGAISQNLTICFTGRATDSTYIRLDSVKVENVTRSWTETLNFPDTVIILDPTTGLTHATGCSAELSAFPNPFSGTTSLSLLLPETDNVSMQIYNLAGQKVTGFSQKLEAGGYLFDVSLKKSQVYLCAIKTTHGTKTVKLINSSDGETTSIKMKGVSRNAEKRLSSNTFRPGDRMRYVGYANSYGQVIVSQPIERQQRQSENITFVFIELPSLTTDSITNITSVSATSGGDVIYNGGTNVIARGVCWSTSSNPTLSDFHTTDSSGNGHFTSSLTNLEPATTYYVRAYATNSVGTNYGMEVSFTTYSLPTITTLPAFPIGSTTVTCSGEIISDGGTAIISQGVCYSTTPNPTIADHVAAANVIGIRDFTCNVTGLSEGTKYYVRAYATNSVGTAYGNQISFTTIPTGGIFSLFAVSPYLQVRFSKGNLQWSAKNGGSFATTHAVAGGGTAAGTWRFADHQYDTIGRNNDNISSSYSGWIDLFGWGTSGYNGKYPYMTSENNSDYVNGYNYISGTNYDWGVYNAISNGGNQAGKWRTLTNDEWTYLLQTRTDANIKCGIACVNGVNGIVLLPDTWHLPNGLTFNSGMQSTADSRYFAQHNNYTADQWSLMEAEGAVFLPASGYRIGTTTSTTGIDSCSVGNYWSSTYFNINLSYDVFFSSNTLLNNFCHGSTGLSVRLVEDF